MKKVKPNKSFIHFVIILVTTLYFVADTYGLPVFPGAEGFGVNTPAGRGGTVYKVTNLNDSGPGSLRAALEASGPRVVIFETSGTIVLTSQLLITNPYCTVAGQTAPSPGITIRGASLGIYNAHDVLIQHIRVRVGDDPGGPDPDNRDGMKIVSNTTTNTYNIVIDHCSVSWGIDENFSIWTNAAANAAHDITISNTIISEALHDSLHSKGPHGKGLLIDDWSYNISAIKTLLAHNPERNPLVMGDVDAVFSNLLVYNAGAEGRPAGSSGRGFHIQTGDSSDPVNISIYGSKNIPGPTSPSSGGSEYLGIVFSDVNSSSLIYLEDNDSDNYDDVDQWTTFDNRVGSGIEAGTPPITVSPLDIKSISEMEPFVLSNAGARPADRDAVDIRIIDDVRNITGSFINSQNDVGGWPVLAQNTRTLTIPNNPNGDDDGDGYTNLEEWLHTFTAQVEGTGIDTEAPSLPGNLIATAVSSTQIDLSWNASNDNTGGFGYKIYRDGSQIDTTTAISYSDSGLYSSTTYNYNISAYDGAGNEFGQSATASATTLTGTTTTVFSTIDAYTGDALNWQPLTPSRWEVISDGGNLRYGINTTSYSSLSGKRLGEYSLIQNITYNDFTLTAKVKSTDDLTTNGSADYDIVFGYQDPNNYYYMMFSSHSANSDLFKVVNGTRQWIAGSTNLTVPDNNYHDIKLERTGSTIQVYFDNTLKLTATDSTFSSGRVGIGSYNDASLWDDIIVNTNDTSPPSPPLEFGTI